jgi:hypothetical protein
LPNTSDDQEKCDNTLQNKASDKMIRSSDNNRATTANDTKGSTTIVLTEREEQQLMELQ